MDEECDEAFDLHELCAFLMMPADEVARAFGMTAGAFRTSCVTRLRARFAFSSAAAGLIFCERPRRGPGSRD